VCGVRGVRALTVSVPPRPRAVQVAERALFLWNNEYIVSLVAQHRSQVLPIVFGALEENANNHWNPAVHGLTCNVRKMFQELDEQLYEECRQAYEKQRQQADFELDHLDKRWAALEAAAQTRCFRPPARSAATAVLACLDALQCASGLGCGQSGPGACAQGRGCGRPPMPSE
jgi:hypothetical protein